MGAERPAPGNHSFLNNPIMYYPARDAPPRVPGMGGNT